MAPRTSALIAEIFGTFALTAIAVTVSNDPGGNKLGPVGIAVGLAVLIYICAPFSGGHLNPAVTWMLLGSRQLGAEGAQMAAIYPFCQFAGAVGGINVLQQFISIHPDSTCAFPQVECRSLLRKTEILPSKSFIV